MTTDSGATVARPTVVLLVGQLCDESVFADQAAALGNIADVDVQRVTSESVEHAVKHVLDSQTGPMALVGFSLGGIVALSCALRAPDRISHLGLICANPHAPRPEQLTLWRRWRDLVTRERFGAVVDEVVQAMLRPGVDDRFRLLARAMAEVAGPEEFLNQLTLQETRTSLVDDLGTITAPTLIMGGANDPLCPPEYQRVIAAGIKAADLHIQPGAGHLLPWERGAEVTANLVRLLETPSAVPHSAIRRDTET
ncbi:hypothetical protein C6I20_03025 [Aeromicrobium sp. A1-2]|uniref:alpha/beta fold hydrolase n=1 Tax=Aeromicrobium sp. A1-2 TaxID=2107713 RepID=UPI000E4A6904|nr:alpha/beta fold hydrolase [Aeromicrobium sp. A1-2]AXT84265.1 hypothetical protein C6I20_03025 [Aeromicrobium sp. A1-2]